MFDKSHIRQGMTVYSADGEKLGKVIQCDVSTFIIEKGFFFPKDYVARFDDVSLVTGDEIRLSRGREQLTNLHEEDELAAGSGSVWAGGGGQETVPTGGLGRDELRNRDEMRVPVVEEEVEVAKRMRNAGDVQLRKDVVTETKHIDVPVTREEVRVERVPASERTAAPTEDTFERKTVSMPIEEEEVEIRKRPVVKEEVRLKKDRIVEQRAAEADVRKERVDIEDRGTHIRDEDLGPSTNFGEDSGSIGRRDPDDER